MISFFEIENAAYTLAKADAALRTNFILLNRIMIRRAILSMALIDLNDVLNFLDREGRRIKFSDHIPIQGRDITEHIRLARGAVSHNSSKIKDLFKNAVTIDCVLVHPGASAEFQQGGNFVVLYNPFPDDVGFAFGQTMVFKDRHLKRAILEARVQLEDMAKEVGKSIHPDYDYMVASYK